MPRHLSCASVSSRSAASCAQIHPLPTDHGSWVLMSARKAHEPTSPCDDYYNRFDIREWTPTESRLSAGSSTGGPRAGTCHPIFGQCALAPPIFPAPPLSMMPSRASVLIERIGRGELRPTSRQTAPR